MNGGKAGVPVVESIGVLVKVTCPVGELPTAVRMNWVPRAFSGVVLVQLTFTATVVPAVTD